MTESTAKKKKAVSEPTEWQMARTEKCLEELVQAGVLVRVGPPTSPPQNQKGA